MDGTVLVADDDRTIRTVLTQALTRAGCKVHATSSLTTLMRWIGEGMGDAVITDVMMPDGNGLEMLGKIGKDRPGLPVIVISAQNTIMTAIKAAEAEAFDYLPKPFDLPDLMKRTARALDHAHGHEGAEGTDAPAVAPPMRARSETHKLIGRSKVMQDLYAVVARVMNADLPVLIMGESGSGKTLVAAEMHALSDRGDRPFVVVGQDEILAPDGPQEILRRAKGGTVLFEEIADMKDEAQARIPRMMDQPGERAPRFMAASQAPLAELLESGALRSDLYYRLDGAEIHVPPLRDRVEDIPLLIRHFLDEQDRAGAGVLTFGEEATQAFKTHAWPGNVRQLENAVKRLVLTARDPVVSLAVAEGVLGGAAPGGAMVRGDEKLSGAVAAHLQRYFDLHGGMLPPVGLYARVLREFETPLIEIALDATGGNQAKCAELLGINRNTLRKKITELDIEVTRRRKMM